MSNQAPKTVSVNVMEQITKHTKQIKVLVLDLSKVKNNEQVKKHKYGLLKAEVWAACSFIAKCINEKALQSDPTGLISSNSSFQDPVNDLCKQWLATLSKKNGHKELDPAAKLLANEAANGSFIDKVTYTCKSGVVFIMDKTKAALTFIWNGIVKTFNWIKGKVLQVYEFVKEKLISFYDWLKSKFSKEKELPAIDINALIEEGEELELAETVNETKRTKVTEPKEESADTVKEVKYEKLVAA